MARTEYSVTVSETSKELTAKERVSIKDVSDMTKIDMMLDGGDALIIYPDWYAILEVHNEQTKMTDKDYTNYVIVDKDGTKYYTGSASLWSSFMDIMEEMEDENEEEWGIKVYRKDSTNFKDKYFITCSII